MRYRQAHFQEANRNISNWAYLNAAKECNCTEAIRIQRCYRSQSYLEPLKMALTVPP